MVINNVARVENKQEKNDRVTRELLSELNNCCIFFDRSSSFTNHRTIVNFTIT